MGKWSSYRRREGIIKYEAMQWVESKLFSADPGPVEPHLLIRARWWERILILWFRCEAWNLNRQVKECFASFLW